MGVVSQLLTLPLAPVRGVAWVVQRVLDVAEHEYYDEGVVIRALADLERDLLAGRIDQKTFERREDELLDRLEEIRRFWAARQP